MKNKKLKNKKKYDKLEFYLFICLFFQFKYYINSSKTQKLKKRN